MRVLILRINFIAKDEEAAEYANTVKGLTVAASVLSAIKTIFRFFIL